MQTADGGYLLLGSRLAIRTDAAGTELRRTRLVTDSGQQGFALGVVPAHDDGYVVDGAVDADTPTGEDQNNIYTVKRWTAISR